MKNILYICVHPCSSVAVIVFIFSFSAFAYAEYSAISGFSVVSVVPDMGYDTFIVQTSGWTGADGAYSIPVSDKKTLWLYGDTWLGQIIHWKHENSTLINNTIALQQGIDPKIASIKFYWRTGADNKPAAFFVPADGHGWFWPSHGVLVNKKLYIFLAQIDKTEPVDPNSIWNFKGIGTWLAEIENPQDDPMQWRINQYKIPFGRYSESSSLSFGAAVLQVGNYLYIYGCEDDPSQWLVGRNMVVARVPSKRLVDFSKWRFYSQSGKWVDKPNNLMHLFNAIAPEYSVNYFLYLKKYLAIYTELGMSNKIMLRVASRPVGPWSQATAIYQCPEYSLHSTYFCYAGKAHPELATAKNELILTYVCNSFDFWQMVKDSRIYFPRYLRMKFKINHRAR